MSAVASINPLVRQVEAPEALRELPGWLLWRYESNPGETKPRKVPHYVDGGRRHGKQGGPEDRAKLTTFGVAREAAARRGYDGVGLAMLPDWGVTGLDFDYCVNASGEIPAEIMAVVGRTYCEYSPSRNGVRAFVKGNLGDYKSLKTDDNDWGLEVFSSKGFLTFTGNALPICEMLDLADHVAPADDAIKTLCASRFSAPRPGDTGTDPLETFEPPLGLVEADIKDLLCDIDPSAGRDDWIRVGMAIHHEMGGEGFELWDGWSSEGRQYPGTESLRSQWDSFDRRDPTGRQVTMRSLKHMSNLARATKGLQPRSFETIQRAADEARDSAPQVVPNRYATPDDWTGKYRVYTGGDFAARPAPKWIIKGVLPEGDLGVIYGQSGSGKSFAILDMALSICRGTEWRGLKVRQGRVLYVAAEGGGGVAQRLKAYEQHHDLKMDTLPLGIVNGAPNLLLEDDVSELVKAIIVAGSGDIIILDTLAQMVPGNENSSEDMGLALRHCRTIRDATGSMVILVHHSGKDQSKGARGWSGLRGATDVELEVTYEKGDPVRVLRVSKQKDGRDDLAWAFRLNEITVGLDDDGDELSSMVVIDAEMPSGGPEEEDKGKRKLGNWERVIMDAIATLDPKITSLAIEELVTLAADGVPGPEEGQRDYRKQNVRRALVSLSRGPDPLLAVSHGKVDFLASV